MDSLETNLVDIVDRASALKQCAFCGACVAEK